MTAESPLALALAYWIEQYGEEAAHREQHENALLPWKYTHAEQRLRMEIALLRLWREPEEAIENLYGLYGTLKEEVHERLAEFTAASTVPSFPRRHVLSLVEGRESTEQAETSTVSSFPRRRESTEQAAASTIALPWQASELPARTRWMLAQMGFSGREDQKPAPLRTPIQLSLALGVCAGLAVVALGTALWRLMAPATPVFRPAVPEAFQTIRIQDAQRSGVNDFHIAIGSPKALRTEVVPARSVIDVQWEWQPSLPKRPNVEVLGKSELWHAGVLPQAIRGCEEGPQKEKWPRRSLFVIQADPSDILARQLAIQLFDRGSADLVLLGPDWATHLDKLIQVDASLTTTDQLVLILPSGAAVPKVDFQGAIGVVTSSDLKDLIARLDLPNDGVQPLAHVWGTAHIRGTPLLRNGPMKQEENGLTFVTVCGGTFTMGSKKSERKEDENIPDDETPRHAVTLSTFEINKTEVTNAQYRLFQKDHERNDNFPVVNVAWSQAKAFCENFGYALPTEAEWEYAARGGSTTRWSFGDEERGLVNYAWFPENSESQTHHVGTRDPNPLGLSDMHGNVWEWVQDCYAKEAYRDRNEHIANPVISPNATGTCSSSYHVLRGGFAGALNPSLLRSANRFRNDPQAQSDFIGFRCVRRPRRQP